MSPTLLPLTWNLKEPGLVHDSLWGQLCKATRGLFSRLVTSSATSGANARARAPAFLPGPRPDRAEQGKARQPPDSSGSDGQPSENRTEQPAAELGRRKASPLPLAPPNSQRERAQLPPGSVPFLPLEELRQEVGFKDGRKPEEDRQVVMCPS